MTFGFVLDLYVNDQEKWFVCNVMISCAWDELGVPWATVLNTSLLCYDFDRKRAGKFKVVTQKENVQKHWSGQNLNFLQSRFWKAEQGRLTFSCLN